MASILTALSYPEVKQVVNEFFALDASGTARVTDPDGQEAVRQVVTQLFNTISDILTEYNMVGDALNFEAESLTTAQDYGSLCQQAMEISTGPALQQTVVALYLLRSKLRSLGEKAKDEREVIVVVDGIVSLMAPGVPGPSPSDGPPLSLLEVWERNREQCARLWTCLHSIMGVMDRHCPDASAVSPPPPPAEATTPAPCSSSTAGEAQD